MWRISFSSLLLCSAWTIAYDPSQVNAETLTAMQRAAAEGKPNTQGCFDLPISCGQTITNSLSNASCVNPFDGTSFDIYDLDGQIGTNVDITLSSSAFHPEITLFGPNSQLGGQAKGTATKAELTATLNSSGTWQIWASNQNTDLELGAYTISLKCSGPSIGVCAADGTTLCLNNSRFQVTATFNAGSGSSGTAQVVKLTDDTGYLWFFSSSNVEAVIKILNGCGLGSHYWVFAGGLTNVNVTITVTDTQAHVSRTYTNPQNTTFLPIQDTSAFATCP
jgi:hypothetical protein